MKIKRFNESGDFGGYIGRDSRLDESIQKIDEMIDHLNEYKELFNGNKGAVNVIKLQEITDLYNEYKDIFRKY